MSGLSGVKRPAPLVFSKSEPSSPMGGSESPTTFLFLKHPGPTNARPDPTKSCLKQAPQIAARESHNVSFESHA